MRAPCATRKRTLSVLFARAARKGESTECGQRVRAAHKRTLSVLFARAARMGESTECAHDARSGCAQRAIFVLFTCAARNGGVY